MNDMFTTIMEYLIDSAVCGLVVGLFSLWLSHMKFKIHVAETYTKTRTMEAVYHDLSAIRSQLSDMLSLLHELKGRVEKQ